jgi:hypothetical protein
MAATGKDLIYFPLRFVRHHTINSLDYQAHLFITFTLLFFIQKCPPNNPLRPTLKMARVRIAMPEKRQMGLSLVREALRMQDSERLSAR